MKIRKDENGNVFMTVKVQGQNKMTPFLAKESEIKNRLNVLEHIYIKYDAYTFRSVLNIQCTDLNNLLTCDLKAGQD